MLFDNCFIITIFVSFILGDTCLGLEHREPEILLQPRNYNPHPYRDGGRRGPVLFPSAPIDTGSAQVSASNARSLQLRQHNQHEQSSTENEHPYANVARKQRIRLNGRYSGAVLDQENNINPGVYSGLANYAAKVLKKPNSPPVLAGVGAAEYNGYPDPSLAAHKKNYAFSYSVRDQQTGDDFSHSQTQNAKATNGEYRVKLPDGRVQIVSYTADKDGYKADVKYSEDRQEETQSPQPLLFAPHHQEQEPSYVDYYDEPASQSQVEVPIYNHHQNYEPKYVTIYSNPSQQIQNVAAKLSANTHQYVLSDDDDNDNEKVHLYHHHHHQHHHSEPDQQQHQQKLFRIVPSSTLPVPSHTNIQSQQKPTHHHQHQQPHKYLHPSYGSSNILNQYDVVSTVAPQHYRPIYITTPKYLQQEPIYYNK